MPVPDISQIQAAPESAPAPAAAPTAPQGDPFATSLAQLPVIQQIQAGSPGAVSAPPSLFDDFGDNSAEVIPKLGPALASINLGFVQAPKSGLIVVFNPQIVSQEAILAADSEGKIDTIATPLHVTPPAKGKGAAPAAPAPQPAPVSIVPPRTSTPSAAATGQRLQSLAGKPPSAQANPGLGIVNGLQKRAF